MRKRIFSLYELSLLLGAAFASYAKFIVGRISSGRKHFLRGILVGVVISVLVTMFAWFGYFKPFENFVTDFLQELIPKTAGDVALLFITDKEYREGFGDTSPLSRKRLASTINMLIKLKARVIALDFDLSDTTLEDPCLKKALENASRMNIPVVLAALPKGKPFNETPGGAASTETRAGDAEAHPYGDEPFFVSHEGFLLFGDADPGQQWIRDDLHLLYGGVIFVLDSDGVLRDAQAFYLIESVGGDKQKVEQTTRPMPSFPLAVAAAYRGMSQEQLLKALKNREGNKIVFSGSGDDNKEKHHEDTHIHITRKGRMIPDFIGNYRNFEWNKGAKETIELSRLLEMYGADETEAETIFAGKIVLVGGVFDKRDFYLTPVGRMSGMEVLANVTQSIVSDNLITHASFLKALALELILGVLVSLAFVLTSWRWATLICTMLFIPTVVQASIIAFSTTYYWFDFCPTIFGVVIHGAVSKVEEHKESRVHCGNDGSRA